MNRRVISYIWMWFSPFSSLIQKQNLLPTLWLLKLNMEYSPLYFCKYVRLWNCLAASFMSTPPCRDIIIEIEDTKPLLASKVGFRTDHGIMSVLSSRFLSIWMTFVKQSFNAIKIIINQLTKVKNLNLALIKSYDDTMCTNVLYPRLPGILIK